MLARSQGPFLPRAPAPRSHPCLVQDHAAKPGYEDTGHKLPGSWAATPYSVLLLRLRALAKALVAPVCSIDSAAKSGRSLELWRCLATANGPSPRRFPR